MLESGLVLLSRSGERSDEAPELSPRFPDGRSWTAGVVVESWLRSACDGMPNEVGEIALGGADDEGFTGVVGRGPSGVEGALHPVRLAHPHWAHALVGHAADT